MATNKASVGPMDRKTCPVCKKSLTHREILRHIRQEHPRTPLSRSALTYLGAQHCALCKQVVSSTGKGKHDCKPPPREFENSQSETSVCTSRGSSEVVRAINGPIAEGRARQRVITNEASPDRLQDQAVEEVEQNVLPLQSVIEDHAGHVDQPVLGDLPAQQTTSSSSNIHYAAQAVPQKAKEAFSQLAATALLKLVNTGGSVGADHTKAQEDVLLLSTRLLHNTNGSHRRGAKVQANIRRYRQGEQRDLQPVPAAKRRAAENQIARNVHKQLQRGNITRATRALEPAEVAQPTAEVMQQLAELHPASPEPELEAPETVPSQVSRAQLKQTIRRLPKGSAPGPSGWTFEHIQAVAFGSEEGLDAVHTFVNALLEGKLPDWQEFRASRLIALQKPNGGVRPIAIGEVWARLVAMCAMSACPHIGLGLAPLQVGVGVRGGAQCLGHAVRAGILAHPEDVTLQLDCKNAFNSLCRATMLRAVAERAPQLFRFALWMYKHASQLWLPEAPPDRGPLWSRSGVRQGDPCGPLFFALAIQSVLEEVQCSNPNIRVIAYLDDIVLQGPCSEVVAAYEAINSQLKEQGLVVQPNKSRVYSPTIANAELVSKGHGIALGEEGIVVAGCPVGQQEFVEKHAQATADKVLSQITTVTALELPAQDKLLILRKSLQLKMAHLARCAQYEYIQGPMHETEQAILDAILRIIDRDASTVDVEQMRLPLRMGGLGLQCLTDKNGVACKAGFLAAAALTQDAVMSGAQSLHPFNGASGDQLSQVWHQVTASSMCTELRNCPDTEVPTLMDALNNRSLHNLQNCLSKNCAENRRSQLLGKYEMMLSNPDTKAQAEQHLARLHSLNHSVSNAWLCVKPTKEQWEIDDATVKSALRFMLGVSPGPTDHACFRCACGYRGSDCHHALTCDKLNGYRIQRHNQIQRTVRYGCTAAGLDTCMEPKERHLNQTQYGEDGYGKRGDILVSTLDDLVDVDICITHPGCETYRAAAAKQPGATAAKAEARKRKDHEKEGAKGFSFAPFCIESYGRLGKRAEELLREWADIAASSGHWERNAYLNWIKQEISLTLIRGNARLFKRFVGILTRGVGQNFQQGCDLPAAED
jgi:hypothetical protein